MIAGAKSLRFLGEGKKLTVPFFQRSYVWEKGNWEELLNTFDNVSAAPFLGSIILKNITVPMGPEEKMIIDGQQRLTTITILAKVIYDCLPASEKAESGITDDVKAFLFYKDNTSDKFKQSHVKIAHSRIDSKAYEQVMRAGLFEAVPSIDCDTINENSSKILQCYKYYREQLAARDIAQLERLHNIMFSSDRNIFVLIELESFDVNEQCIFDTINRAGRHLTVADIIKNNLFKHLLDTAGDDKAKKKKVTDFYEEQWERVFNPDQPTMDLWDVKRRFGNVEHTNLEFLFYCVACVNWGQPSDIFSELATVYERAISGKSHEELFLLVHQILDYARIFKKYILDLQARLDDEACTEYFQYHQNVNRLLLILEKFGIQMFYPYILMRLSEVDEDDADEALKQDFHILESFVMRRKISPRGTHDYAAKCYTIIQRGAAALIESDLCNQASQTTDADLLEYLHRTEDATAKMILFMMELYKRREDAYDVNHLEYKYTLEHIMPKKWETHWSDVPIVENGVALAAESEEGKRFRTRAIQQLGNKTLLTGSLNSTIRNAGFMKKIQGEPPRKPGYESHTSLLVTKAIVDNARTDNSWDEEHIERRTHELYQLFLQLWPSFSEQLPQPTNRASDSPDAVLAQYTEEQLADPIKLLDAVAVE